MLISVVIPFYNTRAFVVALCERIISTLSKTGYDFEVICVDDHSPQQDWELIQTFTERDKRIKLIRMVRNFGQQVAISAGLERANGNWIVVMDADLQDRPEEIPLMLQKAMEGYSVVFARRARRKDSWLKRLYSRLFHRVFKLLTGIKTDTSVGTFGIYNRKVIDAFLSMKEQFRGFIMLISWLGYEHISIDVEHQERTVGKSSYTFWKGCLLALDAFIAFSDIPLKITAVTGFGISAVSLLIGIYFLFRYLLGYTIVLGWTSLVLSLWFLSGVIIMIMGIIGLYLGKVFEETKNRPHYLIDWTKNLDEDK